jgi:hypothetical protein
VLVLSACGSTATVQPQDMAVPSGYQPGSTSWNGASAGGSVDTGLRPAPGGATPLPVDGVGTTPSRSGVTARPGSPLSNAAGGGTQAPLQVGSW